MSEQFRNQYLPDAVSAPGETLHEILESRGMSQAELSERTGRPKKTINEIIKGKTAITPETAIQLERVLDIPAAFWMTREQNYRQAQARAKEESVLVSQSDWLANIPYRAMVNLGWVPNHREKTLQIEELLKFFAVASPTSWDAIWKSSSAVFRKSPSFQSAPGAISAWLRKGEIEASRQSCIEFDEEAFKSTLFKMRSLTRHESEDTIKAMKGICKSTGVAVVIIPELPGTRVWGATRWLSLNHALIQLSLRYKTDDHFWFTFFHEAAHILLHGKRNVFIEDEQNDQNEKETEANEFARNYLIPAQEYRTFYRKGAFSCAAISRFAYEIGISPGIVVGRLQHDGVLDKSECNNLKKRIDWVLKK
jgi:addiction module HigA family antidote